MKTYKFGDYCPYEGGGTNWTLIHPAKEFTQAEFTEAVKRCYLAVEKTLRKERRAEIEKDSSWADIWEDGVFLHEYTDKVCALLVSQEGFVVIEPHARFMVRELARVFTEDELKDDGSYTCVAINALEETFGKSPFDAEN